MKKRKILFLLPLAGMILSGCDFDPQSLLSSAGGFFTQTIPQEFNKFLDGMLGRKSEEPQKEEKEEKPSGEDEKEPKQQKQLVSISVSGQFQELYDIGEEFDPTGIVVTAVYDDESTADVSSQASFSGFDSSAAGSTTVTVSFGGQSAELTLSVAKLSWFAEEKALFDEHLHGIELPFFPVEGAVLSADDAGTLHIFDAAGENLAVSGSTIADYAAKFSADDGWDDVSSDYTAFSTAEEGSFWVFEKSTQTPDGMRRISVQFFGRDDEGYANDGSFYLFASDPFNYVFPADLIAAEFEYYGFPAFTIEAPDAEDLYFEFYPDSYNDLYYYYGMEDYMNATLYIYGLDQAGFSAYMSQLEEAGWQFGDPEQGLYTGQLEIENTGLATMYIGFAGNYTYLNYLYVLGEIPNYTWPAEDIAAAFTTANEPAFEFPSLLGEGFIYNFNDKNISTFKVAVIYVSGTASESDAEDYADAFDTAGWTVTEESGLYTATKLTENGIQRVEFGYDEDYEEIYIYVYLALDPLPAPEWPAENIANYFGEEITDTVPEFEGESTGYQFMNMGYVVVSVEEGSEQDAIDSYLETLDKAGYEPYQGQDGYYVSPNNQIVVAVASYEDGSITIDLYESPTRAGFLNRNVKAFLDECGAPEIPLPNLTAFESVYLGDYDSYYYRLYFDGDVVSGLLATLTGWDIPAEPSESYGYECYYSEDDDFEIDVKYVESSDYTTFTVYYWG